MYDNTEMMYCEEGDAVLHSIAALGHSDVLSSSCGFSQMVSLFYELYHRTASIIDV